MNYELKGKEMEVLAGESIRSILTTNAQSSFLNQKDYQYLMSQIYGDLNKVCFVTFSKLPIFQFVIFVAGCSL